jgi:hypothetical protein
LVGFRRADGATTCCELQYHDEFGVEAQCFRNGDSVISRRFDTRALVQWPRKSGRTLREGVS